MTTTVTASGPYIIIDRKKSKPFAVNLRGGATGCLVEVHRFARPQDAWAFYKEHKSS